MKKRRSSTSDKPNDVTIGDGPKKSKILETCDIYNRNNFPQVTKADNSVFVPENNIDKKCEIKTDQPTVTTNGKSSTSGQVIKSIIISQKTAHSVYNIFLLKSFLIISDTFSWGEHSSYSKNRTD